jgi:hypothetical protein
MRNISEKKTLEKVKTQILYPMLLFFENRGLHEIMRKSVVDPDRT